MVEASQVFKEWYAILGGMTVTSCSNKCSRPWGLLHDCESVITEIVSLCYSICRVVWEIALCGKNPSWSLNTKHRLQTSKKKQWNCGFLYETPCRWYTDIGEQQGKQHRSHLQHVHSWGQMYSSIGMYRITCARLPHNGWTRPKIGFVFSRTSVISDMARQTQRMTLEQDSFR